MVWLSKTEISELIGVSERTIQRNFSQYEYRYIEGVGRGGRVLQIALESLPKEAQDRYHGQQPEKEFKNWGDFTRKQRELADQKAYVLQQYRYSHLSVDEFLERYNADNTESPVSRDQFFNVSPSHMTRKTSMRYTCSPPKERRYVKRSRALGRYTAKQPRKIISKSSGGANR